MSQILFAKIQTIFFPQRKIPRNFYPPKNTKIPAERPFFHNFPPPPRREKNSQTFRQKTSPATTVIAKFKLPAPAARWRHPAPRAAANSSVRMGTCHTGCHTAAHCHSTLFAFHSPTVNPPRVTTIYPRPPKNRAPRAFSRTAHVADFFARRSCVQEQRRQDTPAPSTWPTKVSEKSSFFVFAARENSIFCSFRDFARGG